MRPVSVFSLCVVLFALGLVRAGSAIAGEVRTVTWKSDHASPPAELDDKMERLLPLIRLGVAAVPEAKVMRLTFIGGSVLGLPADKSKELHGLLAKRYRKISKDSVFADAPSALPFCYSAKNPQSGRASVYVPDEIDADTRVILFLHGYGGSFVFYQHYLAEAFPDHVIICPAYGISCAKVPSAYLEECLAAISDEIGVGLQKPVLIGLSAGGIGGFREYARNADSYLGYVCLAASPPRELVPRSPVGGRIRLIAGGEESFVKDGELRRAGVRVKHRTADYESHIVPGEGHFFMLSAEEETKRILKKWDVELRTPR